MRKIAILSLVAAFAGFGLLAAIAIGPDLFGARYELALTAAQGLVLAATVAFGFVTLVAAVLALAGVAPRGHHAVTAAAAAVAFFALVYVLLLGGEARAADCGPPGRVVAKLIGDGLSQRVSAAGDGRSLTIFEDRAGRWVALDWRDGRACITDRGAGPVVVVVVRGERV